MYVHNLSAVGEQYLDFEPADDEAPVRRGRRHDRRRPPTRCPTDEADLLVELDDFVKSVDEEQPPGHGGRARAMFEDTGEPLAAAARQRGPVRRRGGGQHRRDHRAARRRRHRPADPAGERREHRVVLPRPPAAHPRRSPDSDQDLRQVLQGTPGHGPRGRRRCSRTSSRRCRSCSATRSASTRSWSSHLRRTRAAARRRTPASSRAGFTGTHRRRLRPRQPAVRQRRRPCTAGYVPPEATGGRATTSPTARSSRRGATAPALRPARLEVLARDPAQPQPGPRGRRHLRPARPASSSGAVDADGDPVRYVDPGNLSILGGDSWKWLLVGPVS